MNSFVLTPKRWVEQTGAKGIVTKQGRYAAAIQYLSIILSRMEQGGEG